MQRDPARIHIGEMESEPFPRKSGVRQEDPISPKLFAATIEDTLKNAEVIRSVNIDREILIDMTIAYDEALFTETLQQMDIQMITPNTISENVVQKFTKEGQNRWQVVPV
ncbi:hypothetical protein ElyMa_005510400 [Elysia marginata]|uniref:Reverse transcriptase domain-containing protein n=1 Tax=Elysia marginata TaxID=1093978 RepID=A0AAV4EVM9_9GAST|nr:hypothetical protein ElyMa_005510400 [Elysia marginata]